LKFIGAEIVEERDAEIEMVETSQFKAFKTQIKISKTLQQIELVPVFAMKINFVHNGAAV